MSQFLSKKFPSIESFYSDITQLGKGLHVNEIRLCGGEPLLNPEINSFIEIAKKAGIADRISVTTNGLLLHKMNDDFWENVDSVVITLYPKVHLEEKLIEEFKRYAKQSKTDLTLFPNPSFRTTIVTQPHPKDLITDLIFKTCDNVHLHHCHMIHEGKLYKCAVPPFLPEYLAKMGMAGYDPAQDALDIHKAKDIFHELKAFLLSSDTMEACRYCLGYLGKSQAHCQIKPEVISDPSLDKITRKEYFDLHKLHKLLEDLVESENDRVKEFGITKISEKVTGPRCSVIIPTYNRSRYLPKAINSVLSQTFQDFEIIVVDDCSTDNTIQIIQEFVKHDSRIKLLRHEKNKGAQAARNTGIVNSTAEYVAFLDSDDEWLPERLRLGFEVIEAEAVPVVHSEAIIHKNGQNALKNIPPLRGYIYPKILNEPGPMFQGLLLKKECLEKIGLLDETIISWQEWDTFIRLAKYFEFGFVSEPCFIWHWHEGHTISKDKRKEAEGYYQIVEKHADEIIKYAGTEALMNHYMITLEKLKALTAYEKFQQVKVKLKALIDVDQMCCDKVDVDKTKVRTRYSNLGDRLDIYRYAADRFSEKSLSFKNKLLSGVYTIRKYPCPICNNINEWHLVVFSDEGFEWSVCKRCGLLQQNCRLSQQDLKEFYESGEYSEISMTGIVNERAFTLEYEASSVYLDNLTNQGYDFSRLAVLDIGCGYGGTLLALKELGAAVKGFDLDPQSIRFGQNYVKEIEVGDVLDFNCDLSRYNLILLNNVIEHLSCPVEFLLRLREKIKNNKVQVFIDVPNLEGAHNYYHNPSNNHLIEFLHLSHIWYFTSVSLERLLNQTGFRVDYINNRGAAMSILCSKSESPIPNNNNSLVLSLSSIDYANYKFKKNEQSDVKKFEEQFSAHVGRKFGIAVSSDTAK